MGWAGLGWGGWGRLWLGRARVDVGVGKGMVW